MTDPTAAPQSEELPAPVGHLHSNGDFCQDRQVEQPVWWPVSLYTEDQARAALAAERAKSEQMRVEIGQLRHELRRSGDLAEARLKQMNADRAQALRWRDELHTLRGATEGDRHG